VKHIVMKMTEKISDIRKILGHGNPVILISHPLPFFEISIYRGDGVGSGVDHASLSDAQ
jgi:hypothetical protein